MKFDSSLVQRALNRREFLSLCAASGFAYRMSGSNAYRHNESFELRIGIVATGDTASASSMLRGIDLGIEEGARTAAMFRLSVQGERVTDLEATASRFSALVGGATELECRRLVDVASANGILFLNTGCTSDALRSLGTPNTFHIAPSESMLAEAVAHVPGMAAGTRKLWPVAWHSSLTRFGAEQLSARFRSRFDAEMDGAAWCGWMAVKILVESALRCKATESDALRAYLEAESSRFDGHKGASLSFRREDHQLRQPVYVLESEGSAAAHVVAEST